MNRGCFSIQGLHWAVMSQRSTKAFPGSLKFKGHFKMRTSNALYFKPIRRVHRLLAFGTLQYPTMLCVLPTKFIGPKKKSPLLMKWTLAEALEPRVN